MKIKAYKTDCCQQIKEESEVVGLIGTFDLFVGENYTTTNTPNKADIHFCLQCYRDNVIKLANRDVPHRQKNEDEYKEALTRYGNIFKKSVYNKSFLNNKK